MIQHANMDTHGKEDGAVLIWNWGKTTKNIKRLVSNYVLISVGEY
jgi:hypothetical protein